MGGRSAPINVLKLKLCNSRLQIFNSCFPHNWFCFTSSDSYNIIYFIMYFIPLCQCFVFPSSDDDKKNFVEDNFYHVYLSPGEKVRIDLIFSPQQVERKYIREKIYPRKSIRIEFYSCIEKKCILVISSVSWMSEFGWFYNSIKWKFTFFMFPIRYLVKLLAFLHPCLMYPIHVCIMYILTNLKWYKFSAN